jgi:hypothetical protein
LTISEVSITLGVSVLAALLEGTLVTPPGDVSPIWLIVFKELAIVFEVLSQSY